MPNGWRSTIRAIICASLLGWPIFVFSENTAPAPAPPKTDELQQQIEKKRQTIKELEASIEEYKKKVSQKQLEATSFKNQIAILNNHAAQLELNIAETQTKLETLQLEIEALQAEAEAKQRLIDHEIKLISGLVRTLYAENSRGYLEILLAYRSFSDFYNRLQYVQTVERDLGQSAKTLRLAKAELDDKKQQTEERQRSYQALKSKLTDQQLDLKEQAQYKETLLNETKSSEATYRTLLDNLRGQYQAIEDEIAGIEKRVRQRLEEENRLKKLPGGGVSSGQFFWPTQSRYITAYFHDPEYPFRRVFEHSGADIRLTHGTPVKASGTGYVARAKRCATASCYSFVMIIHGNGLATLYGHLSRVMVEEDELVTAGDIIGISGGTPGTAGAGPFVTGPHLHFEIRRNGIPIDPLPFLPKDY